MKKPTDHKGHERQFGIRGEGGEHLGDYFDFKKWPERQTYKVTRLELAAILMHLDRLRRDRTLGGFFKRFGRFLSRPLGSKPTDAAGKEITGCIKPDVPQESQDTGP